jgi:hypothetical protein
MHGIRGSLGSEGKKGRELISTGDIRRKENTYSITSFVSQFFLLKAITG